MGATTSQYNKVANKSIIYKSYKTATPVYLEYRSADKTYYLYKNLKTDSNIDLDLDSDVNIKKNDFRMKLYEGIEFIIIGDIYNNNEFVESTILNVLPISYVTELSGTGTIIDNILYDPHYQILKTYNLNINVSIQDFFKLSGNKLVNNNNYIIQSDVI